MAEDNKSVKKPRIRSVETIRERAEKAQQKDAKSKRRHIKKVTAVAAVPFKYAHRTGKKEYYPIKPRDNNRIGRALTSRRRWIPRYFREAWGELRQVIWPTAKETWNMTVAVFIFAAIFGLIITITDFGLEKLFRRILL